MTTNNAPTTEPELKRRVYKVPIVVLYISDGTYCAQLAHPIHGAPEKAIKKSKDGINTALGQWLDLGYHFGTLKEDFPFPNPVNMPKNAKLIGCRSVTYVPFPY